MNFKVDEDLPIEGAQLFSQAGHSVSTALQEGLGGATDQSISGAALREGRILVTLDTGFADIRTYPPAEFPGLIVLRLRRQDKPHVLDVFGRVLARLQDEPIQGKLWIVEERRIRVRS